MFHSTDLIHVTVAKEKQNEVNKKWSFLQLKVFKINFKMSGGILNITLSFLRGSDLEMIMRGLYSFKLVHI